MGMALASRIGQRSLAPLAPKSSCCEQDSVEFDEDLPPLEEVTGHESQPSVCEADRELEDEWRFVSRRGCRQGRVPLGMELGACMVCFDEDVVLRLECQHLTCRGCLRAQLAARWPGSRMTFGYLNCGACRAPLLHPSIGGAIADHHELRQKAIGVAVAKYRADDLHLELARSLRRKPKEFEVARHAEAEMAVYKCHDCREPFCGGRVDCIQALESESRAEDLCCPECKFHAEGRKDRRCNAHGPRFAVYKCDSCCNVASWLCSGGNHYCDRCHDEACVEKHYPCPGPGLCPLGMAHPPNGPGVLGDSAPGFVVGCTACMGCVDANHGKGSEWGEDHPGFVEELRGEIEEDELDEQPCAWAVRKEGREAKLSSSRLRQMARRARTSMGAAAAMRGWGGQRAGCRRQWPIQTGGKDGIGIVGRGSPSKQGFTRGGRHKVSLVAFEDVYKEVGWFCELASGGEWGTAA